MAVLGGGAVSYERSTPVGPYGGPGGGAVSYERGTPVSHAIPEAGPQNNRSLIQNNRSLIQNNRSLIPRRAEDTERTRNQGHAPP